MPDPLWFKAKRYGYGWYPATWQGWLAMLVWLIFFLGAFVRWDISQPDPETRVIVGFVCDVGASTAALLVVCALTGERPRWRWGGND